MPSHIAKIEIYDDGNGEYSFGCPDLDLMGYGDMDELFDDIIDKLFVKEGEGEKNNG